jgi:branched-chain amino acid aminotransferase
LLAPVARSGGRGAPLEPREAAGPRGRAHAWPFPPLAEQDLLCSDAGGATGRAEAAVMALANERIAYFNGEYVPESQVKVPFRDRSWIFGDGAFDMTRTFNGRLFKIREHIQRLYRSLKVLRIDPGLSPAEMIRVSEGVNERNLHLLGPDEDQWVGQRISRGVNRVEGDNWDHYGPTVIVESMPLPFKQRARLYRDGIDVVVPSVRRVAPDALTPRAKTHNYLNLITADLEAHAHNAEAWTILLDVNGNLCEGLGANIFVVKDGRLRTPFERYVLPGVSRATAIELAASEKIPFAEADIDLYDGYTAEEAFITSTSFCICPIRTINGTAIGAGTVPGPITRRLTEAYIRLVDCDFVAQYLKHLG